MKIVGQGPYKRLGKEGQTDRHKTLYLSYHIERKDSTKEYDYKYSTVQVSETKTKTSREDARERERESHVCLVFVVLVQLVMFGNVQLFGVVCVGIVSGTCPVVGECTVDRNIFLEGRSYRDIPLFPKMVF